VAAGTDPPRERRPSGVAGEDTRHPRDMKQLLSDGELIPTELARRFEVLGYRAIAFTDHVDTTHRNRAN